VLCEESELIIPLAAVCDSSVYHHERLPLAGNLIIELRIADTSEAAFSLYG
jgi:hypothetical protein